MVMSLKDQIYIQDRIINILRNEFILRISYNLFTVIDFFFEQAQRRMIDRSHSFVSNLISDEIAKQKYCGRS